MTYIIILIGQKKISEENTYTYIFLLIIYNDKTIKYFICTWFEETSFTIKLKITVFFIIIFNVEWKEKRRVMSMHIKKNEKKTIYTYVIHKVVIDCIRLSDYVCIIIIIILLYRRHKNNTSKRKKIILLLYDQFREIYWFIRSEKISLLAYKIEIQKTEKYKRNIDKAL